jgi:transposase InsO family protein
MAHGIEHRLHKPGRPQTNGMEEQFNGRISDMLTTRHILQAKIWNSHSSDTAGCTITISRRKRCIISHRLRDNGMAG